MKPLTKNEAEARVAKGAAHLDTACPGWHDRIDIGRLDLASGCFCIMGQLRWTSAPAMRELPFAIDHGVFIPFQKSTSWTDAIFRRQEREYRLLQDAWIAEIAARRHPVSEPVIEAESTIVILDHEPRHAVL